MNSITVMKNVKGIFATFLICWFCAQIEIFPQTNVSIASASQTASMQSSKGLLNHWLKNYSTAFDKFDIGGQFRIRYEVKNRAGSFPSRDFIAAGQDNSNNILMFREKIHLGYTPVDWLNVYVEGRDSSSSGDDRNPNPETDHFDLHQAYAVIGNTKDFPLSLKIGRQEMIYGDERQIGALDWGNVGRVFDSAKIRFQNDTFWLDGFAGRVVLTDDGTFNEPNDYDWFWGVYGSTKKLIPFQETDLYILIRNVGAGSPNAIAPGIGGPSPRDIYTFGIRAKSLPDKFGGWDYLVELSGQVGSINSGGATPTRRDHRGLLADASIGYTFKKTWGTPRIGLGFTHASGDKDPADDVNETFDPLFPTNHKFYGLMDLWGPRNINSPRVSFSIKPEKRLSVVLDYHLLWLADDRDFFYPESGPGRSANGYGRNSGFSKFVGSEINLVGTFAIKQYADLQIGYGHFFVGDYIKQSVASVPANNGHKDADWFYIQTRFNF